MGLGNIGPLKPDALLKARSVRAQFGAKSFGPLASPAHETEARSSKGGLVALSSSKLQCSDFSAKEVLSIVQSQESSKKKSRFLYPFVNISLCRFLKKKKKIRQR